MFVSSRAYLGVSTVVGDKREITGVTFDSQVDAITNISVEEGASASVAVVANDAQNDALSYTRGSQ